MAGAVSSRKAGKSRQVDFFSVAKPPALSLLEAKTFRWHHRRKTALARLIVAWPKRASGRLRSNERTQLNSSSCRTTPQWGVRGAHHPSRDAAKPIHARHPARSGGWSSEPSARAGLCWRVGGSNPTIREQNLGRSWFICDLAVAKGGWCDISGGSVSPCVFALGSERGRKFSFFFFLSPSSTRLEGEVCTCACVRVCACIDRHHVPRVCDSPAQARHTMQMAISRAAERQKVLRGIHDLGKIRPNTQLISPTNGGGRVACVLASQPLPDAAIPPQIPLLRSVSRALRPLIGCRRPRSLERVAMAPRYTSLPADMV